MRRTVIVSAVAALLLAGCGATPQSPDQARRAAFLQQYKRLHDDELARLCPSLYPADFLKDAKKYRYTVTKNPAKVNPQDMAAARTVGCTTSGTPPRAKP